MGFELRRTQKIPLCQQGDAAAFAARCSENARRLTEMGIAKVHYGCGARLLRNGWLNVDRREDLPSASEAYMSLDLALKHPFPSEFFRCAYAEDFIELLDQAETLEFLSEAFRTLRPRGVLRLSFPGLPGVLRHHYRSSDWEGASTGRLEAFTKWRHKHFYCRESLALVARHLGFSDVRFVEYGQSAYEELRNLESRPHQTDVNICAELIK